MTPSRDRDFSLWRSKSNHSYFASCRREKSLPFSRGSLTFVVHLNTQFPTREACKTCFRGARWIRDYMGYERSRIPFFPLSPDTWPCFPLRLSFSGGEGGNETLHRLAKRGLYRNLRLGAGKFYFGVRIRISTFRSAVPSEVTVHGPLPAGTRGHHINRQV